MPIKRNNAIGHDNIESNYVVTKVYDEISFPLIIIFHSSPEADLGLLQHLKWSAL